MRLSQKIFIPITVLVCAVLVIFSASLFILQTQKNALNRRIEEGEGVNALLNQLEERQRGIETTVIAYSISRNPRSIDTLPTVDTDITTLINELKALNTDTTGSQLINRFSETRSGTQSLRQDLIDAISSGNEKMITLYFSRWDAKTASIDAALNDLISFNLVALDRSASVLNRFVEMVSIILIFLSATAIATFVVLWAYFRKIITKPIAELSRAADMISSKKFDIQLDIRSDDELGTLSRVFGDMAHKVRSYYEGLEGEIRKKDDFIGIASHELKTPLTSLKIYVQSLGQLVEKRKHAEYKPFMEKIDAQADRMNQLVANLLDIARIEGGRIAYDMKPFDLRTFATAIIDEAKLSSEKHSITLSGNVSRPVCGDRDRIAQVLSNLLTNAIKYSPDAEKIEVTLSENGDKAIVAVRDYGIGISPEYQSKIFNRFYRVTGASQAAFPGMGVGLYISSQIILQHNGEMWVESAEGSGSVFYFSLPFA